MKPRSWLWILTASCWVCWAGCDARSVACCSPVCESELGAIAALATIEAERSPTPVPPGPTPSPEDCETCDGSGWITHGDGHRTRCPDCGDGALPGGVLGISDATGEIKRAAKETADLVGGIRRGELKVELTAEIVKADDGPNVWADGPATNCPPNGCDDCPNQGLCGLPDLPALDLPGEALDAPAENTCPAPPAVRPSATTVRSSCATGRCGVPVVTSAGTTSRPTVVYYRRGLFGRRRVVRCP